MARALLTPGSPATQQKINLLQGEEALVLEGEDAMTTDLDQLLGVDSELVETLLAHLTPSERLVVERVRQAGGSFQAAADELGMRVERCHELWTRAMAWMRELLDDARACENNLD